MDTNYIINETIAAISTPPGEGGIAVVRISGPDALKVLKEVFYLKNKERPGYFESHKLIHGVIYNKKTDRIVDSVMATYMKSPNTYTGEDTAEIYCHGGYIIPQKIIELIIFNGARPAEAGEFTKRAYLNGKMDLTQAEAVANIIHAQTESGAVYAEQQLQGLLSEQINKLKDIVLDILAEIEAHLDFPEEDIEETVKAHIIDRTETVLDSVNDLISSYNKGRIFKHGIVTAILGKPNVGKSSLLNRLLNKERAIVSPHAGTTRDFIEEVIDLDGIPLKIIDTAGMRSTTDEIEKAGVSLAGKKANEAELLIIVLDGSSSLDDDDFHVLDNIGGKKCVVILNKTDLGINIKSEQLKPYVRNSQIVDISALTGEGIELLKRTLHSIVLESDNKYESNEVILTDLRHKNCLSNCASHLSKFLEMLRNDESPEFLAMDIRAALDSLGEITGEITTEDILGRIFSKFCIGK